MSDRLVAYPPDFIGPFRDGYRCNEWEWVASTMVVGDHCWFRHRGDERWISGTFKFSYFYDGVIARVYEDDPDDYIEHSLFLDLGDELVDIHPDAV